MMIAEEFIDKIINKNLTKVDILNYTKEYFSIGGELDSLIMKMMANISTDSQIVFTGDRGNDGIEEIKVIEHVSIEKEKQNDKLFEAMGVIEAYKEKMEEKEIPEQAPKPTNTKSQQEELTEREKQYYEKAITQGMAIKTDSGYKWLYCSGSKVSLVYFLSKVFCPKGVEQIPFKRLNNLWGVSRLDSANDQLANAKKPQRWRQHIDNLF
ncbi:hypothetical protein [Hoylesella nanceiensis]|jgi:hypothetical protein|uniref:hypothetical protein n=1 Tax=Hoylesella nanceiensis TaxID=425941 RepID=UPI001CB235C1|nr:hypothetical protein [Hoylesella nanceiensis]MBF1438839.1 hypothetical protein [Hoylesella nanceiensis]